MNNWGPNTWILFHTMAEKINDNYFDSHFPTLWKHIVSLCHNLPCPSCSEHASLYLHQFKQLKIQNKNKLKLFLFTFHNEVNINTNKKKQPIEILNIYNNANIKDVFINFLNSWTEISNEPNVNLMAYSFTRKKSLINFHKWFYNNQHIFNL